jgi:hypothetical protein
MERLDGAGLQEVPEEARSLTSRAAYCQSAIRGVESPLCCSHARQGLTSRHRFTPKRVNRVGDAKRDSSVLRDCALDILEEPARLKPAGNK